jgi:hypothetical protein
MPVPIYDCDLWERRLLNAMLLRIEVESEPYQRGCGNHAEAYAEPLINTRHIEYDEHGQQAIRKDEEVLRFQTFELNAFPNAFIHIVLHNRCCVWILKEEGAQNRGGDNQEDTRTKPRGRSFRCIEVARTKLVINFDTAN